MKFAPVSFPRSGVGMRAGRSKHYTEWRKERMGARGAKFVPFPIRCSVLKTLQRVAKRAKGGAGREIRSFPYSL